jgi:Na+-transporting NADH:ubiquinone oxidoreductase subunit C
MSTGNKSFMESSAYPVLFMLLTTVIFVGILSIFYRSTEKSIETAKKQAYQLQIMSLFADTLSSITGVDKVAFTDPKAIQTNFPKYIKQKSLPQTDLKVLSQTYYAVFTTQDNIIGYCFDVTGSGLWGTMHGLLAVSPDYEWIINFMIYDQMETPGLGARVEEGWFKKQFAGKPLISGKAIVKMSLVPEGAISTGTQVRQITGATITSSSVLKIIEASASELKLVFDLKAQ